MKIHTGDTVLVITGKDKGKQGRVLRVFPAIQRIVVEGINMRVRHIKKTVQQPGQRIKYEASIHASNAMVLDPKTKKPTRIGYTIDLKTGKKLRIARVSGEAITGIATVKTSKTAGKSEKEKKTGDSEEAKSTAAAKVPATPSKQPFWKRGGKSGGDAQASGAEGGPDKAMPTAHRSQGG